MGIIVKPQTFTGSSAPQLPWLDSDFDALFSEFNGEIDNANLKGDAAIAQSKILNLITDLAARLLLSGGKLTGRLDINMDEPYVRLIGTEALARDWRVVESGGVIALQINTGTEAIPVWGNVYVFAADGVASGPTSVATKGAIAKTVKTDADFTTVSEVFVSVTGADVTLVTGANRVRITAIGHLNNNEEASIVQIGLAIDGADVESGAILAQSGSADDIPMNFSYITDALTAASHVFSLRVKSSAAGNVTVRASEELPLIVWAEELKVVG